MHLTTHQKACLQAMDITLYEYIGEGERGNDGHIEHVWLGHLKTHFDDKIKTVTFENIESPLYDSDAARLVLPAAWSAGDAELKKQIWRLIQ